MAGPLLVYREPQSQWQPASGVVDALKAALQSLREVLAQLDADAYQSASSRASGSVGGHVRHCLDHVGALVSASCGAELTYDSRLRGTPVERDPSVAMAAIDRVCFQLDKLQQRPFERAVRLRFLARPSGPAAELTSTLGREVAFVLQHTIHHCAIVAILLEREGIAVPERFGYAPSTPPRA
jgi:uncharacterized damage-inducible protein DinB